MIKMLTQNMTKRATQGKGFGVIIGRCFPNNKHGRPSRHPVNVAVLYSGTQMII